MRRKENRVIKPAGSELMDYLNKGYAICNKCGAVMDRKEDPEGGCDIYTCPSCGWEIDEISLSASPKLRPPLCQSGRKA